MGSFGICFDHYTSKKILFEKMSESNLLAWNHNTEIFLSFALYFPYKFWQRCWQSFSVSHSFMSIHVRSSVSCCQNLYSDWLSFNQSDKIIIFWRFSFIKFKSFSTTTLITAKSIRAGVMTCSTMGSALINIITFKRDLIIFCSRFATAIIWTSCIDACCIFGTYGTACAFVYILVALIFVFLTFLDPEN